MKLLADPKWQGVSGIATIIGVAVAIITAIVSISLLPDQGRSSNPSEESKSVASSFSPDAPSTASPPRGVEIPAEANPVRSSGGGGAGASEPAATPARELESPEAFRPTDVRERFLPLPYAQSPRRLTDWLQTSGSWLYYRYGVHLHTQGAVRCEDIRAVGEFGWTWESGIGVVCFDTEWLGINVQEIIDRRAPADGCAKSINIVTRDPMHWGQHGAPPQAVGLDSVNFISFRVVRRGEHVTLETC